MPTIASKLQTVKNNIEVFGMCSTIRAELAKAISPRYHSRSFDRRFGTDTESWVSHRDGEFPAEYRRMRSSTNHLWNRSFCTY